MATVDLDALTPPVDVATGGFFPYGFKKELKALLKLSWPTSLSILFHQMLQPISLAFCGHLGDTELAAVAMSLSYIYMTTVSIGRGLAFGGDTFFSQTYGSANKTKMGVYLQKALLFGVLTSLFTIGLLMNTENFLLLARQPPEVARLSQQYCMLFSPGALAYCWLFILMRYLLCQNRVIPNLVICLISCGICSILNYGLVYQADMGISGSAIALAITYYLVVFQLAAYIWASGIYRETWSGWTWECLLEWGVFAKVALSSVFMTFIFWFYTEVGSFFAGLLSPMAISAFSIHFQIEGFAWMIPLGLGGACTARIGQYLGAKDPTGAITVCRVTLVVQVVVSLILAALTYFPRHYIPQIFTKEQAVIDYTASIIPIVAIFILLEGTGGVGVSIIRGTGRQTLGAVIIFLSGYVFSLPIGIPLMFLTQLGLAGLWWGYVVGLLVEDLFLMIFVGRLNWMDESIKAQERAGLTVPDTNNQVIDRAFDEELDENSPLLGGTSESVNTPGTPPASVNWTRVIILRLLIFLLFVGFVVGSYLMQLYVKVPFPWNEMCVMTNLTDVTMTSEDTLPPFSVPMNTTLPPCNYTFTLPVHEMWFVANMP